MNVVETALPGVLLLEPRVFRDERGYFLETYQEARYAAAGIPKVFVQDNLSHSRRGTLRGLHFQEPHAQGKLVQVLRGAVLDVVVDVRRGSPTFGRSVTAELSEDNHLQMWIPEGFAHGFCVTSEVADFHYKCTDVYVPSANRTVLWNDPELAIAWPLSAPLLSPQDAQGAPLREMTCLPLYAGR